MNPRNSWNRIVRITVALLALTAAPTVWATPYASGISNDTGTVYFTLNEPADNVKIIFDGGGPGNTNDLGALSKGVTSFLLGAHTSWQIHVTKSTAQVWTRISADTNVPNQFFSPRSIDVNRNPASPYFGRVYVMEHAGAGGTGNTGTGRSVTKGLFALNADLTDALGQGNFGLSGGLDAYTLLTAANNRFDPWKISVGEDDYLYVSDAQNARGAVARVDGNLSNGELVLTGVGNTAAPTIHTVVYGLQARGSLAGNNLKVYGIDGQWQTSTACNSILRWDINGDALPYATPPTAIVQPGLPTSELETDLDVAPDGNIYVLMYRGAVDAGALKVYSPGGTLLWTSLVGAGDVFLNCSALKVSPDNTRLAIARRDQQVWMISLTNGPSGYVPDLSTTNVVNTFTSTSASNGRTVSWDAAGNLYVANQSSELLRVFSPGGSKTTITKSDNTFQIITPPTVVSVAASTPLAREEGLVNGVFTLTRIGDTGVPLAVAYTAGGTATSGSDYTALAGTVTFQAGAVSTNITVAVLQDTTAEFTETVTLTIGGSLSYGIGTGAATVSMLDNETPEIVFSTIVTNKLLESYSPSKVNLQLVRRGLLATNLSLNLTYAGAATRGVDFNGGLTVNLASNAVNATLTLTPINDQAFEGDELIVATVTNGSGYVLGTTNSASALVVDDEYPSGAVLFSDDFNGVNSSSLWAVNLDDPTSGFVEFNWDYSTFGIPVAPGTTDGSTLGLRMRCGNTTLDIDGLSLSPLNGNFTGNYRLKFDLWINYNGPMPDGGPGSTQNFDAGVGTTGDQVVWFNGVFADCVWFTTTGDGADGDADGDYTAFLGANQLKDDTGFYAAGTGVGPNTGLRNSANSFYALWGGQTAPAAQLALFPTNQTGVANIGNAGMAWHTVVITKAGDTVKWQIDGVTICTVTNDLSLLSTNVFVGYQDKFASGNLSNRPELSFGLVDNLKVEAFVSAQIHITGIQIVGANVEITFTGPAENVAADFKLQSTSTVTGTYTDDNTATPSNLGSGVFKFTTALGGGSSFYKIKL